jgi:hypothetical protein
MPNWCENKLAISGKRAIVNEFYDKIFDDGEFLFLERFLPTPKELLEVESPTKGEDGVWVPDWYEWRLNNWGCKWEVSEAIMIDNIKFTASDGEEFETIVLGFETPWSPPIEGLTKIAKMYPEIQFFIEFLEPGMAFMGFALYKDGELSQTKTVDMIPNMNLYLEDIEYQVENNNKKDDEIAI